MKVFNYGGFSFEPVRKFNNSDGDFVKISHKLKRCKLLKLWKDGYYEEENNYNYSYEKFYSEANSKFDIFKCLENGKLYVPCSNELFEYI